MEEDQIEVQKEEPSVEVVETEEAEPLPLEKTPDEGISELKKKLEVEKRAREEAQRRAYLAQAESKKAKDETKDANYQLVVNAIETVKGRGEAIKSAYASAMASGDYEKAAQLQEALAINAQQLQELKRGKKALKEEQKKETKVEINEPLVDQMARTVSPRSASWLKANRDHITDERSVRRMLRAHEDAVDDGIEPDSDEYFSFIENRLGISKPVEVEPAPFPRRQAPPPAAPVSRGNQRPNVVRLTKDQVEMAKTMGMTEAEYAKNMLALREEGKLSH